MMLETLVVVCMGLNTSGFLVLGDDLAPAVRIEANGKPIDTDVGHAAPVQLVPPGEANFGPQAPKDVRRGVRSKICVADWNGDGKPDLLVGDFASQAAGSSSASAAQYERHGWVWLFVRK
jgi:hypothetical protein